MPKTLILLRHAKAAAAGAQNDHERPLADRGVVEARHVGQHFRQIGLWPEQVLLSPSLRTLQTLEFVEAGFGAKFDAREDARLYLASANEILKVIRDAGDAAEVLLIIGHNPGLQQLAAELADDAAHAKAESLFLDFPTAAFAVYALPEGAGWKDIGKASLALLDWATPASLKLAV